MQENSTPLTGPHVYANSGIWYDSLGNIKAGMEAKSYYHIAQAANWANVILITPIVVTSATPLSAISTIRNRDNL